MNRLGRAVLNSRARGAAQRRYVVPTMGRLGGRLDGARVLEVGCGQGVGSALLVELLGAGTVDAFDIDPVMVWRAAKAAADDGLGDRVRVGVGDMVGTEAATSTYDAVVDMGAMHLEPRWRDALAEVRRVLRPGGRFYFEEIIRPRRQTLSVLATGRRVPRDFALAPLLAELEALEFVVVGVADCGRVSLTGVVGDIVGVAAAPPAG